MKNKKNDYNENSIKTMGYPECIQKRPSMYIGCIDIKGNTHLVREVIDNSVDEALNGYGKDIKISLSNKEGYCEVVDEGRGIPAKAIEKAFTTIHASGKFDNDEYATSAGTNGVGCTAVNALSSKFYVECTNNGKRFSQEFHNGLKFTELKELGKTKEKGTLVRFYPNKDFMETNEFDIETIENELSDKSYVLPGISLKLINQDNNSTKIFKKNSLKEFIKDNSKTLLNEIINFSDTCEFVNKGDKNKKRKFEFELAFAYDKSSQTIIRSFCNSLVMREGGIQETSFKTAITRFFKNYIEENKMLPKKDEKLEITGEHVQDGLVCIISIKHPTPIFENQTKNKLTNKEISTIQKSIVDNLKDYADTHPKDMKNICNKIILSAKASEAARKAKETVKKKGENQFSIVSDLSKLANCVSKDITENELFITEGRSASGTAKEARDKRTQAVYSLRGKILNTIGMEPLKILANKECADLAYICTGLKDAIGIKFDIKMLKYGKIIALCDADVDGFNIVILLMVYIFETMRPIIEEGHFYVAIPPLYSIVEKGKKRYFVDQDEYDQYIYEKIFEKTTFVDKYSEKINSVKKLNNIFKKYEMLDNFINNLVKNNTGINASLLIDYVNILLDEDFVETKDFVNEYCEDISYNKSTKVYDGFYNGDYVSFTDETLWEILNQIDDFIDDNKIPISDIFYEVYYEDGTSDYKHFFLDDYRYLMKEVTPKSRCRMKGLGEMDADELRDTTLDIEKRNIYKIEIEDVEKAMECLNNYMNGNSKFADVRKAILLKKQDEIARLNLI